MLLLKDLKVYKMKSHSFKELHSLYSALFFFLNHISHYNPTGILQSSYIKLSAIPQVISHRYLFACQPCTENASFHSSLIFPTPTSPNPPAATVSLIPPCPAQTTFSLADFPRFHQSQVISPCTIYSRWTL